MPSSLLILPFYVMLVFFICVVDDKTFVLNITKHGCACGTKRETDRYIINCGKRNKKQHQASGAYLMRSRKIHHKKDAILLELILE
ncbi:hypothetical protein Bca4012_049387 [Brassica carinata]